MQNFGKKDIFALTLVCQIICVAFVFFYNLKTIQKGSQRDCEENTSTAVRTEDLMEENKPAWKIRKACRDPSLRILYFVYTAPKNTEKRRWIRKTIGDAYISDAYNSAIAFFVGEAADMNDSEAILDEALSEGDIAVLNFTDTYKNLPYKFLQGAKWVSDNCLLDHRATVVKVDDDVLVNLPALSSYLNSGVMELTGIHCAFFKGAAPHRTSTSKWYVSKMEYARSFYPPYCAGAAWIMRPSVMFAIYEASSGVPFFWVEDVYITGLVAEYAKVPLVQISQYVIIGKGKTVPTAKNTTIFFHTGWYETTSADIEEIWNGFKEYNRTVEHSFNRNVHVYYRIVP